MWLILYPFEKVCQKTDLYNEIIENIDIGGHTLIRASNQNNSQINILTNPNQYDKFISCMPLEQLETLNTEQIEDILQFKQELVKDALNCITPQYDVIILKNILRIYLLLKKYFIF